MLVDDEDDIVTSVMMGLESRGFRVEAFTNPYAAWSHFRPDHYDSIILDIRMPGMNGFDLARKIWLEDKAATICFFTAFEEYENEALRQFTGKSYCFIKKPIGLSDLVAHIHRHLYPEPIA